LGRAEPPANPPPPSAQEVLAAYESACEAISSFDLYLKVVTRNVLKAAPGKKTLKAPRAFQETSPQEAEQHKATPWSHQYFADGKFRADVGEWNDVKSPPGARPIVWDGAVEKTLDGPAKRGTIREFSLEAVGQHGVSFPNLFRSYDVDFTYAELFKSRPAESLKVERQGSLLVLSVPPEPDKGTRVNRSGVRLSLDPERGFLPAQIDILVHKKDAVVPWTSFANELSEVLPGVWAPLK